MTQYSESYCLAILITNLKRRKRYPNPITLADCAKVLYDMYGSFQQVAKMVDVHPSVIRKWVGLANAPEVLRRFVKEGSIYPVAAFTILAAFPDDDKRIEISKEVSGWGEPEIVRLIRIMKKNPQLSTVECKNLLMEKAITDLISEGNEVINENDLL